MLLLLWKTFLQSFVVNISLIINKVDLVDLLWMDWADCLYMTTFWFKVSILFCFAGVFLLWSCAMNFYHLNKQNWTEVKDADREKEGKRSGWEEDRETQQWQRERERDGSRRRQREWDVKRWRDGGMQIEPIVLPAEQLSIVLPGRDVHISRERCIVWPIYSCYNYTHTHIQRSHTITHANTQQEGESHAYVIGM